MLFKIEQSIFQVDIQVIALNTVCQDSFALVTRKKPILKKNNKKSFLKKVLI